MWEGHIFCITELLHAVRVVFLFSNERYFGYPLGSRRSGNIWQSIMSGNLHASPPVNFCSFFFLFAFISEKERYSSSRPFSRAQTFLFLLDFSISLLSFWTAFDLHMMCAQWLRFPHWTHSMAYAGHFSGFQTCYCRPQFCHNSVI